MKRFTPGLLGLALFASACFPGGASTPDPAGFFTGIWHGWLAPISLIASIFNPDIGLYAVSNTGWPYDLGFYMAIISGFGGLSLFRKRASKGSHRT